MTVRTRGHRRMLDEISSTVRTARSLGVMHQHTDDESLDGRTITLDGRRLRNFGSCSYLGLELDPRIKGGAVDAVERYGTTFSSSRAYVSLGLYEELEERLGRIFGAPVVVTPTTTLGHLAAIPALIGERDAIVLDRHVHESVRMAARMVACRGAELVTLPHNDVDALERLVHRLAATHRHVWYFADGVYSMYGDVAPLDRIGQLLDDHEQLRLYIDDAHGTSWTGLHGRGHAIEVLGAHPRAVVAVSLSKSFAAGGAAIVFGDPHERERVLYAGQTLIFGGPVPPGSLGAAVVSARIHESGEIHARQDALRDRMRDTKEHLDSLGLPLVSRQHTPITFIGVGSEASVMELHQRLRADGIYVNASAFPAVPPGRGGIRFTTTLHQRLGDIEHLLASLSRHLPEVLAAEGRTVEHICERFDQTPTHRWSTVPA